ncbi:MAG: hypothetical protein QW587_05580 [Candidatus Bathyarchaeia archaeon]
MARLLGVSIPGEVGLQRFLEESLMERLGASTHKELEKALEEAYRRDSEALKRLLQELLLFYRTRRRLAPWEKRPVEAYAV